jgi:hypothetical protein
MTTAIEKSWALEIPSSINQKSDEEDILLNSLESDIRIFQRTTEEELDFNSKITTNRREDLSNNDGILFSAPIIPQSYLVTDSRNYFTKAQKWIGHVSEIGVQTFKANLKDLNTRSTDEVGEFDLTDISQEDKELLSIGAAFYWSVGLANQNGQIEKKSLIRFQRLKPWTFEDYEKALLNAEMLYKRLNLDQD